MGAFVPALVDIQPHNLDTKSSRSALASSLSPRPPPSDLQMVPLIHLLENNLLGHLVMTKPPLAVVTPSAFRKQCHLWTPVSLCFPLYFSSHPLLQKTLSAATAYKMCDITEQNPTGITAVCVTSDLFCLLSGWKLWVEELKELLHQHCKNGAIVHVGFIIMRKNRCTADQSGAWHSAVSERALTLIWNTQLL